MVDLFVHRRRRNHLFCRKSRNCHFSLMAVLELGPSRNKFDGRLCVWILQDIVCLRSAQPYFSPRLPTCVHFRKMVHFSSLGRKVRESETWTATLPCQYNSVTKTTVDLEKNHVHDWELERVFSCRAFLMEKERNRSFGSKKLDENTYALLFPIKIRCCFAGVVCVVSKTFLVYK